MAHISSLFLQEQNILQRKLDQIHQFFVQEVAANRNLELFRVQTLATGEFYLGVEALELGLVDELGDKDTAEEFMKKSYGLERIDYIEYQHELGFFELLSSVVSDFFFKVGEGMGSVFVRPQLRVWM